MPLVLADRVRDTTTTTGTGTVTLSGTAPSGYQNFSVVGNGNTTYYTINAGSQWEVGIGTYSSTGPTLARTTVLASSNSGSLVDFSAGTKDVFVTYPAGESVYQDGASIAAGTAILGVPNGGTGAATLTTNGVLYGNGTSALAVTAAGTTGQVLVGNTGGAPSWASLSGIGVTSFSAGTTGLTPSTGTTGAVTLAGTLGVANGGTGATTLSSGYLVKGNGTSAVSASVIYDNGANVGIGTSSATERLTVSGNGTFTNATYCAVGATSDAVQGQYAANGAAGEVSLRAVSNHPLNFFTNNTERMRITAAGFVGIGTVSPSQRLDVAGSINAGTTNGVTLFMADNSAIRNLATAGNTMYFDSGVGTGSTGGDFQFRATGSYTTRLYINGNTGNVGIGTTSASERLTVQGNQIIIPAAGWSSGQTSYLFLGDGNNGVLNTNGGYQTYFAFNGHSWNVNSSEAMRIDGSRNVGIGTSTPGARLDVYGASTTDIFHVTNGTTYFTAGVTNGTQVELNAWQTGVGAKLLAIQSGGGNTSFGGNVGIGMPPNASQGRLQINQPLGSTLNGALRLTDNATTSFIFNNVSSGISAAWSSGALAFGTGDNAFVERMRIDSSGNVLIGTSSSPSVSRLYVDSTEARIQSRNSTSGANGYIGAMNPNEWRGAWAITGTPVTFGTSDVERMRITSGGDIGVGTSAPLTRLFVETPANIGAPFAFSGNANGVYPPSVFGGSFGYNFSAGGAEVDFWNGWTGASGTQGGFAFRRQTGASSQNLLMLIRGDGNVGIGTSSPASSLQVVGAGRFGAGPTDGTNAALALYNDGTGASIEAFQGNNATVKRNLWLAAYGGNVGIGTTTTTRRLEVVGPTITTATPSTYAVGIANTGGANGDITLGSDASYGYIQSWSKPLYLNKEGNNVLFGSGNVGIGLTNPTFKLQVNGTFWTASNVQFYDQDGFRFSSASAISAMRFGSAYTGESTAEWAYNRATAITSLSVGNTGSALNERLRVDASGNVAIGTSTTVARFRVAAGGVVNAPALGNVANYPAFFSNSDTGYGLGIGTNSVDGHVWLQAQRSDSAVAYNLTMQEAGGSVGIGTSSPNSKLDVVAASGYVDIRVRSNTTQAFVAADTSAITMGTYNAVPYLFSTNNTERMRITAAGDVGIGTSSPNNRLTVVGGGVTQYKASGDNNAFLGSTSDTSNNYLRLQNSVNTVDLTCSNGSAYLNSAQSVLWFGTNGVERMRLSGSELLVGTTTGGRTVCINAADNWMRMSNPSRSWLIGPSIGSNFNIWDETGGANRFYIDSGGTAYFTGLLIGRNCTSTDVNAANDTGSFSVRGSTTTVAAMSFHRTGAYAINMGLGTDAVFRIGGWSASSNCFQMDGSGNLTMAGNVTAYSDARLKKDVETIDSALDLVSKMRGVRYTRIGTEKRGVGVIAQEMLEVLPEVVQQGVGDDDTLSVAYGNLVGVLIEAIKELRAEIVELKGK